MIYKQLQVFKLVSCGQRPKEENDIAGKPAVWLRGQPAELNVLEDIAIHPPKKTNFSQQFWNSRVERSLKKKKKNFLELKCKFSVDCEVLAFGLYASLVYPVNVRTIFNSSLHIEPVFLEHK